MKNWISHTIISSISIGFCFVMFSFAQDNLHPYNKVIMKLYPRPYEFKYPEVPRILARDALLYLKNGEAVFIGCGASTNAVPGGFYFRDCAKIGVKELRPILPKNKLLIVY
jgi:hypothetical protein